MPKDLHNLCFNCGFITPDARWFYWHWDDEGNIEIPAEEGYQDAICRCPVCRWDHQDDDSGPGLMDGTFTEMQSERKLAQDEWKDRWEEAEHEVFGL